MTTVRPIQHRPETAAPGPVSEGWLGLQFRPIKATDEDRLVDFHSRLLPATVYLRFFNAHPRLSADEVSRFTHVDGRDRFALVAIDESDQIVAVARYDRRAGSEDAEVAFVVADPHQGHGLGHELLRRLVVVARDNGIRRFVADTMVGNHKMLSVLRDSGLPEVVTVQDGLFHIFLDLAPAGGAQPARPVPPRGAVRQSCP